MKKKILNGLIGFYLVMSATQAIIAQKDGDDFIYGKYHVLHSNILDADRVLLVHLPDEYKYSENKYPVIVKLFGTDPEYFSYITSTLDMLSGRGLIPKCIFIGVDQHGHGEVIPPNVPASRYPHKGDAFLEFVTKELVPYVDTHFRTLDFRILMGSYDCGIFGLYCLVQHPELFNGYLINSPGRYGGSSVYLETAYEALSKMKLTKKFLHLTYSENERDEFVRPVRQFIGKLETHIPAGLSFSSAYLTGDEYDEFTPYIYCKGSFLKLFEGFVCPTEVVERGLKAVIDYYKTLSMKLDYPVAVPSSVLDATGNALWRQRKLAEAEKAFLRLIEKDPRNINGYFRMAELTRFLRRFEDAKAYYQKCLDINPNIDVIKTRRQQIDTFISQSAAYKIEQTYEAQGMPAAETAYKELKSSDKFYFNESEMNALGYRLAQQGKENDALKIFIWNVEMYPASANAYDSLAEIYMRKGMKDLAVKNYEKSLTLNPENTNAKKMLEKLRGN